MKKIKILHGFFLEKFLREQSCRIINPFYPSVTFYTEISHLFCRANKLLVSTWNATLGWNGLTDGTKIKRKPLPAFFSQFWIFPTQLLKGDSSRDFNQILACLFFNYIHLLLLEIFRLHWCCSYVVIVNVLLLLPLNIFHTFFCFYCWLWTSKCLLNNNWIVHLLAWIRSGNFILRCICLH